MSAPSGTKRESTGPQKKTQQVKVWLTDDLAAQLDQLRDDAVATAGRFAQKPSRGGYLAQLLAAEVEKPKCP